MDGLSIIGIALGVGVIVYALSLRGADESLITDQLSPAPGAPRHRIGWPSDRADGPSGQDLGFGAEPLEVGAPDPEPFVYVPVLAAPGTRWQTRIGGAVGLLALVTVSAIAVALGVYQVGHALNQTVQGFLGK